ncbi:myo inositol monophosphatase [Boletus edulis BED1]|uniref:Inositol-1-monophosphatase n=1 Tax=Boletus edulis BED1 TaxID=1328754 RepID=A0AAD4BNY7_BOLED|nr:myo inositol monophosphatase [Boletus edulis BED1]
MSLGPTELRSILTFTVNLTRRAGTIILEGSQAIQSASFIDEKKNSADLVTEYDIAVENLVLTEIKNAYPSFQFIGEETYASGVRAALTDDPTFCVDPIDGTTNFVHGFPFCCISLGLIYQKRVVLGVVYNPFLDYLYTAIESQGSYLTRGSGQPMKLPLAAPKPLPSLSKALIDVEWGSDRATPVIESKCNAYLRLVADPAIVEHGQMAHAIRTTGSGAINFCLVAQGAIDVCWEIGCWPWDVCAAIVIIQEAGGSVTSRSLLASERPHVDPFTLTPEVLMGREFLVVRAIQATRDETNREAQLRLSKGFYETVGNTSLMLRG